MANDRKDVKAGQTDDTSGNVEERSFPSASSSPLPGQLGNPGRPRGSLNKKTVALRERLIERADELINKVLEMCEDQRKDAPACPMCGRGMMRPEELRLRAIQDLLSRAGLGHVSKQELTGDGGGPLHVTVVTEIVE